MLFFVHQTIYLLACTCIRLFICGLLLVSDYYLLASTLLFICYFLLAVIYLISHSLRVRGCARGHADIRGQRVRVLFYARSGLRARVLACGCGFIKPISARILPVAILGVDRNEATSCASPNQPLRPCTWPLALRPVGGPSFLSILEPKFNGQN